ncbi:MAG TPA: hypothetical protein DCE41_11135 [Cytophagales bacterium]|nr:hypothetical protein [Cytophagales bacterium]HAA23524.1 hypothetical protein [Cytophagales bacterium]HAP62539.1 hypothetical protein [Cytophagales bacterium]
MKTVSLLFAGLVTATVALGQNSTRKPANLHLHVETEINATAEQVWEILAHRFGEISEWSHVVDASRPLKWGDYPTEYIAHPDAPVPARETTSALATLVEVLIYYNEAKREFIFDGVGLPGIITYSQNHTQVAEVGPGISRVSFDIALHFKGPFAILSPLMKKRMSKTMAGVLEDLKVYAEAEEQIVAKQ